MLNKLFTLIIIVACIHLVSCDQNGNTKQKSSHKIKESAIHVSDAFVRAMPPGQKITAAFLKLQNNSNTNMALISAESNVSEFVELHAHTMVDGMMNMGQVDEIVIPKNGSVALETGGYHIMMINLKKDLVVGQKVDIKLNFKNGSSLIIHPEVKKE